MSVFYVSSGTTHKSSWHLDTVAYCLEETGKQMWRSIFLKPESVSQSTDVWAYKLHCTNNEHKIPCDIGTHVFFNKCVCVCVIYKTFESMGFRGDLCLALGVALRLR